ncbi:DEAD/DEAH box helicase [Bacteroides sp.]|uniref:DEAD/DEAH box helicase n=1 Tax=Bacteroides sp. TaxID=29523 RepID=UPI0025BF711E|nr:DEAD/DEAH box helicase [Bacteroides sp.]
MKERTTNEQVIIVFTEHPVFGILLIPYMAEKLSDDTLQLVEQAFHASPEAMEQMSEAERQAIDIASYYTEKYLMNNYSREKTVSRFLHKLSEDPERIKNSIRPFIEKKLQEMLTLIRESGLPFYQKQAGSKVLYAHHAYRVHANDVEIRVTVHVDSKTFRYQLECYDEGQRFSLTELKPVIVLTSAPASLLLGMELYFFPHIESARILPFTKKKSISVDASQIEKYIDNIVIPIARYHEIETHGLNIIEEQCTCEALLSLDTAHSEQVLRLSFRYGDQMFTPDSVLEMKKIVYRKDSGKVYFFRRNITDEERAIQLLTQTGLQPLGNAHFKLSPEAPERTVGEWINNHREMLQLSFQLISSMGDTPYCLDEIRIEQSCDDEVDWFELHITVVVGTLRIPFSRFRKHILEEKREYLLPDGRMILLPEEWFSKYVNLLEMGIQTEKGIRLKRTFLGAVQSALGENELKQFPSPKHIHNIAVPKALKATLRPYQQKGFSWMVHLHKLGFGGCLADDMGLGKTLQTLTLLQYIYKPYGPKQAATLIVVPTSLLHNWQRETKRFTMLSMAEYNNTIAISKEHPEKFFGQFHLIITTYGMMRNNIDILSSYNFEYIVLDESQNIKNSDSLTFRSAIQLRSNHRLVLTGTPIENSLKDLWAQFHFIQPDLLGTESAFQRQFMIPLRQGNTRVETQLQQLILPFILRRSKKEVAPELPALTEEIIYCDMTEEQDTWYEQEKNSLRNILLQHPQSTDRFHSFSVLNGILRLRQLACHPQLIFPDFNGSSGKTAQIIETFDTLRSEGHKVLIFSSFVKHLEVLAEAFQERGWKYALLTGATNNRPSEIAHFTEQKDVQAFLISLKAGGVGLNLTQADYVFIIDPWWNPAAESQAIARAHRIGQDKQVIAYRFITQNSIEEKILYLQDEKRKLAETFVTDSEVLPALSNEQWVDLLK